MKSKTLISVLMLALVLAMVGPAHVATAADQDLAEPEAAAPMGVAGAHEETGGPLRGQEVRRLPRSV